MPLFSVNPPAQTRRASGSAASPGGSTAVATVAAPPAGPYRITVKYLLTGTQEVAVNNLRLRANNASFIDLPTCMVVAQNQVVTVVVDRIDLDGVNAVTIGTNAAATGGAVYSCVLSADRIG